jgi:SpoVK/Ycf46/Vps4 family AAA+-type ATPase
VQDNSDLTTLIRSRIALIVVETPDELLAVDLLRRVATVINQPLFKWTVTEGLHRQENGYEPQKLNMKPQEVLANIKAGGTAGIYLLIDFHPYLQDPLNVRLLKEVTLAAEQKQQTIILLSNQLSLPPELDQLSASYKLKLPDKEELKKIVLEELNEWAQQNNGRSPEIEKGAIDAIVHNLRGVSVSAARRLTKQAIQNDGALTNGDLKTLVSSKVELLNRNGVLTFEPDTKRFADIGGLENLKTWLSKRKPVFRGDVEIPGLPVPKGIMLLGVQGCGKSLAAKVIAGIWEVPLLLLDIGAIYNKYIGETERNTRESLQTAEALAPCVLWIDEIEKGLSTRGDDNGTSQRVLGTFLTWMAEQTAGVFIVATANDIQALPPELIRKGRLDEIFFVDLPDAATRREIFTIHLEKRGLDPEGFYLDVLVPASEGFSGAEIEQAVVAGLYSSLGGSGKLDPETLIKELKATRPLSVLMAEKIAGLRAWAADRTVPAG